VLRSANLGVDSYWEIHDELWDSDHYPAFITMKASPVITEMYNNNKPNYEKANWEKFKEIVEINIKGQKSTNSVKENYNALINVYKEASKISIYPKKGKYKHKYSPFWNAECSKWKKTKKEDAKNLRKSNTIENQIAFKKSRARFRLVLKEAKTKYWQKYCESLNCRSKVSNVWNTVRRLNGNSQQKQILLKLSEGLILDKERTVAVFANTFMNISSNVNLNNTFIKQRNETVNKSLKEISTGLSNIKNKDIADSDMSKINKKFTRSELEIAIKSLKINSSARPDEVPYIFRAKSPDSAKFIY